MERGLGTGSDRPCFSIFKLGKMLVVVGLNALLRVWHLQVSCLSSSLLCLLPLKGRQDSNLQMNTEWFHNLKIKLLHK